MRSRLDFTKTTRHARARFQGDETRVRASHICSRAVRAQHAMSSSTLASFGAAPVLRRVPIARRARPRHAVRAGASRDAPAHAKKASKTTHGSREAGVGVETSSVSVPLPVAAGGGLVLGLGILRAVLRSRNRGSLGALEERGALDENRDVDEAKFYKGMMKSVRTVRMPELTETQIEAARERRRQSRINEDGEGDAAKTLRATELPSNHPFATSEAVDGALSAAQAKKIREMNAPRVKRGRPRSANGGKDR